MLSRSFDVLITFRNCDHKLTVELGEEKTKKKKKETYIRELNVSAQMVTFMNLATSSTTCLIAPYNYISQRNKFPPIKILKVQSTFTLCESRLAIKVYSEMEAGIAFW